MAVHQNSSISKIDKFNYLNSLLEGAAARTLQSMQLTEDNYDAAVEILQARFGDPQQIIARHMEELLLRLPDCTLDKPSSSRNLYNKLNAHIRRLTHFGMDLKDYRGLLISVVMSKMPDDVRLHIARENKGEIWKMDKLLEMIRVEVEAR